MANLHFDEEYNFFRDGDPSDKFFKDDEIIRSWFNLAEDLYTVTENKKKASYLNSMKRQLIRENRSYFEDEKNRDEVRRFIAELETL